MISFGLYFLTWENVVNFMASEISSKTLLEAIDVLLQKVVGALEKIQNKHNENREQESIASREMCDARITLKEMSLKL